MENEKTQILQRLKEANNVLVTVSQNPSVDQLAAAIGMTLVLNKLGKHGTAVFSGATPSTIEFLKPEDTLEKTTDSLRDFIIALDKAKADKLRYKVEDQHVKIFITPYRTTITQDDLDFSHGDFNVDVVLALGVHVQQDLDQAITAHGRILHDATVVSVNTDNKGELGGINFSNPDASSLSELAAGLSIDLKDGIFDEQIATAFLTGIVAETDRFSNEKTKPATMTVSAKLMAAGANQQLVAAKLTEPEQAPQPQPDSSAEEPTYSTGEAGAGEPNDGSLAIEHSSDEEGEKVEHPPLDKIHIDEHGNVSEHKDEEQKTEEAQETPQEPDNRSRRIIEPPSHGGTLTASGKQEQLEPSVDPLSAAAPQDRPILSHKPSEEDKPQNQQPEQPSVPEETSELPEPQPVQPAQSPVIDGSQTLEDLEKAVDSPHQAEEAKPEPEQTPQETEQTDSPDLNELQSAVSEALVANSDDQALDPIEALNANPVNLDLGHEQQTSAPSGSEQPQPEHEYLDVSQLDTESGELRVDPASDNPPTGSVENPSAPPPVPPPMMPPAANGEDDDISLPPVTQ